MCHIPNAHGLFVRWFCSYIVCWQLWIPFTQGFLLGHLLNRVVASMPVKYFRQIWVNHFLHNSTNQDKAQPMHIFAKMH